MIKERYRILLGRGLKQTGNLLTLIKSSENMVIYKAEIPTPGQLLLYNSDMTPPPNGMIWTLFKGKIIYKAFSGNGLINEDFSLPIRMGSRESVISVIPTA